MASTSTAKRPDLTKWYNHKEPPLHLDTQEFRLTLLRPGVPDVPMANLVPMVEWRTEVGDPVLHGMMTVQVPESGVDNHKIREGYRLRLDCKWFGRWQHVWTMRLYEPDAASRRRGVERFYDLHDDGYLLQTSRDDFNFTKGKHKPKGWRCHEIAIWIARRYKIKLGKIAKGKHYIKHLSMQNVSPMQLLQRAYAIERQVTGHRFVARFYRGKLEIVPLRRNPLLYTLGPLASEPTVARTSKDEKWATAVTVRGAGGGDKKKVEVTFYDQKATKKYGVVHKNIAGKDVDSEAEAIAQAKRYLAKHSHRKRTLTFSHPGIAFIRRGDALRVRFPGEGFKGGPRSVGFVTSHTHRLTGSDFTMSLDLTFDDPYVSPKQRRQDKDAATRAEKRAQR